MSANNRYGLAILIVGCTNYVKSTKDIHEFISLVLMLIGMIMLVWYHKDGSNGNQ